MERLANNSVPIVRQSTPNFMLSMAGPTLKFSISARIWDEWELLPSSA